MQPSPSARPWLVLLSVAAPALAQATSAPAPPARELLRTLTARPRVAGTPESLHAVDFLATELARAGYTVERERFEVVLSLPRRLAFSIHVPDTAEPLVERVETWDPDARNPGDIPKFAAWTANGELRARCVNVGRGLRDDYRRLAAEGVDVRGKIALASFGGAYRGIKVDLAEEHGCAAVLLYSPESEDGAARGAVWPEGPWKPGHDAQRGSISPMGRAPGDPSTPGWPSSAGCKRIEAADYRMPKLMCLPIGWDDARRLLERPEAEVELAIDAPLTRRPIVNVIGVLPARDSDALVVAGSHRDSWVRGANDSGGGCVALLRAAQRLTERPLAAGARRAEIRVCFWDAEEHGLIGSTEHAEARAQEYRARLVAYVNSDANVSGPRFGASGSPGMMRVLRTAASSVGSLERPGQSLWDEFSQGGTRVPSFGLPGSGSDFAVFVHHLGRPMLELGFHGNSGGQYHTTFDDFEFVERHLDPGFAAHEKAGEAIAALLFELAAQGRAALDGDEEARELAKHARLAGIEKDSAGASWLGQARGERLAGALEALAGLDVGASVVQELLREDGIAGREWFRNPIWAPGLENGYSSETFPTLRAAARAGERELELEFGALLAQLDRLRTQATSPDTSR
ncbi:MAG: M28 family peptidase [Planctomycetes bacterium]|nr:M28 family peptidase [Planctomycetota bacterium]